MLRINAIIKSSTPSINRQDNRPRKGFFRRETSVDHPYLLMTLPEGNRQHPDEVQDAV